MAAISMFYGIAWIELHKDELVADWELAVSGQQPFRIDPLR